MMALGTPASVSRPSHQDILPETNTFLDEGGSTGKDDGKWAPGKYEGGNTGFDDGQYHGQKE